MFCRGCGEKIPVDSIFCPSCGKHLVPDMNAYPQQETDSSVLTAANPKIPLSKRVRDSASPRYQQAQEHVINTSRKALSRIRRFQLDQLLYGTGTLFSVVGFILGVSHHGTATTWLIFGLILIISALYHRGTPPKQPVQPDPSKELDE